MEEKKKNKNTKKMMTRRKGDLKKADWEATKIEKYL